MAARRPAVRWYDPSGLPLDLSRPELRDALRRSLADALRSQPQAPRRSER
jgi:hypothetical protein